MKNIKKLEMTKKCAQLKYVKSPSVKTKLGNMGELGKFYFEHLFTQVLEVLPKRLHKAKNVAIYVTLTGDGTLVINHELKSGKINRYMIKELFRNGFTKKDVIKTIIKPGKLK